MRYRSMGPSGAVVSAISLSLASDPARPRASDWTAYIYAALEHGVSTFEVSGHDPVVIGGLAEAVSAVDRRLLFVSWRLGSGGGPRDFSPAGLTNQVRAAIARTGLQYLDAVVLDEPGADELLPASLQVLVDLKTSGAARFIGLGGEGAPIDDHIAAGGLDLLIVPFNLTSGWSDRNRIRAALAGDMAVVGYRAYPRDFHAQVAAASRSAKAARSHEPLAGVGAYGFLDSTHGWTAEEICIAYALTESALSSVQVPAGSLDHLARISAVPDREMPSGLAAQIEMARFTPHQGGEVRRTA